MTSLNEGNNATGATVNGNAGASTSDNNSSSAGASHQMPVVGNLHRFAAFPPNFNGPIQPGILIFDAAFESGNLGRVEAVSEFEFDLFIRPDTCNSRFRVWYNFTAENSVPQQRVLFNIVNSSKTRSLYRDGMTPIVRSTSRPFWSRIPQKQVFWYRSPDHRRNYVLSFAFCFDRPEDIYQFAYAYPYTYSRLQRYLDNLESKGLPVVKRELLAYTVQRRRVDLLTITNRKLDQPSPPGYPHHVVFITARVHPGETPASFVCQGLIDFLVSSHPLANALRDALVFMIVPMLNPDGVYLGNYRCSLMGFDLNRQWQEPSRWAHPSVFFTKQLLLRLQQDQRYQLDFFIDLHAHTAMTNGFMYGNAYDDPGRLEQQTVFPRLLAANAEDFSFDSTNFNRDAVKAGTSRRALGGCLHERCTCYTLEVSFYGYYGPNGQLVPYTEDVYMRLGRSLARTFLDYYRVYGHLLGLPLSPTMAPWPPQQNSAREGQNQNHSTGNGSNSNSSSNNEQPNSQHANANMVRNQSLPAHLSAAGLNMTTSTGANSANKDKPS